MPTNFDRRAFDYVVTTLTRRCWSNEHLDEDLRDALDPCLRGLGAVGAVVHFNREDVTLAHALRPRDELSLITHVREQLRALPKRDPIVIAVGDVQVVGSWVEEYSGAPYKHGGNHGHRQPIVMGYSVVCFDALPQDSLERDQFVTFHSRASAGVIFQAFQHRARLFLPFAPRIAERYWLESGKSRGAASLTPPWESTSAPLRTATLGFDLRKSTFCMENADDPKAFAEWLDQLVQILMKICHFYGGVFDKFTGDGVLVHFLSQECKIIDGREAVTAAVLCAVAMQHATRQHLERLRRILRLNSGLVGGAIGIDVAFAHWSLDHRHNPVTVGRGVVNACRLMDSTTAGGIRLTNIAYQKLADRQLQRLFVEVPFTSKEFDEKKRITAWELKRPLPPIADVQQQEIRNICEASWKQSTVAVDG